MDQVFFTTNKELIQVAGIKENRLTTPFVQKRLEEPVSMGGRVEYVFRPKTSYPPRIYVFMHAERWLVRNRRNSGCAGLTPFYSRPMNQEKLIYHHFDIRETCYQYENWDYLIAQEQREADAWNKQKQGFGDLFLRELESFENKYRGFLLSINPVGAKKEKNKITRIGNIQLELFED